VSVPIYKLEQWRDRALAGIDTGLKERENDPLKRQLDEAKRRIGELVMEVEILQKERQAPFGWTEVVAMSRQTSEGAGRVRKTAPASCCGDSERFIHVAAATKTCLSA
jgi:hypothetical protein